MSCVRAPAGFASGPIKLNTVRSLSSRRTGAACFIAGCRLGANRNPIPISRIAAAASSGVIEMRIPSASRTSALPVTLVADRPPCFATRAPAPAITNAATVEMLNVPDKSPPVPHVSINPAPASTTIMCSRSARANPVNSAAVSPFILIAIANPAIWAAVASPSSSAFIAACASSAERCSPDAARCR